jgi:FkbM family methyltransferase
VKRRFRRRIKGVLRRWGMLDRGGLRGFLHDVTGLVHVGAHLGQERDLYSQYGLNVLWIEPLGELFRELEKNIAALPRQRAVQCLVTDRDDVEYPFHVASNDGASSSILELHLHRDIWREITYTRTTTMKSKTLATIFAELGQPRADYDALVMDTQGSELLVLKGAEPLLPQFKYIQTEVADFEAYKGCFQLADIESYLFRRGYRERARKQTAEHPQRGRYYDIVYERQ